MLESAQLTKTQLLQGVEGVIHSRKVARNTVLYRLADGTECVKYHDTVVVRKDPNGIITLNSGGYHTKTTKERFWEYGKIPVSQKNGIWYMPDGSAFYDGIQVRPGPAPNYGRCVIVSEIKESDEAKVKEMKARIKSFTLLITKDRLPYPDSGDCWLCCMRGQKSETAPKPIQTIGDFTGDHEHLLSHIEDGYVHGSLLVNAMMEHGFGKEQIGFYYHGALQGRSFELSMFRRAVTKYLQRRLLPGINVR